MRHIRRVLDIVLVIWTSRVELPCTVPKFLGKRKPGDLYFCTAWKKIVSYVVTRRCLRWYHIHNAQFARYDKRRSIQTWTCTDAKVEGHGFYSSTTTGRTQLCRWHHQWLLGFPTGSRAAFWPFEERRGRDVIWILQTCSRPLRARDRTTTEEGHSWTPSSWKSLYYNRRTFETKPSLLVNEWILARHRPSKRK